ncbi:MAG: hypothetical protein Q9227_005772 [Pyrenula ochraceoflavens]
MAEPLSITAGVLGILRVSLSILSVLKSATVTPKELARLEAELEHLGDVLEDIDKLSTYKGRLTGGLVKNAEAARLKVQEVHDFIQTRVYREHSRSSRFRWKSLVKEAPKLKGFAEDLASIKIRLLDCLAVSNLTCALDIPSHKHTPHIREDKGIEDSIPEPENSPETAVGDFQDNGVGSSKILHGTVDGTFIAKTDLSQANKHEESLHPQSLHAITSLVEQTRHAVALQDPSLRDHLARIYREMGENRLQIKRLTQVLGAWRIDWRRRRRKSQAGHISSEDIEFNASCKTRDYAESCASDIFFDCISRFSDNDSNASMDRLQAKFSGTPDYVLETSSNFFPEVYTTNGISIGAIDVIAMSCLSFESEGRVCKFFCLYTESPRNCQRVTIYATMLSSCLQPTFSDCEVPSGSLFGRRSISSNLQHQLGEILKANKLFQTVTKLSLTLTEAVSGQLAIHTADDVLTEDTEEAEKIDEKQLLRDIDDMGYPTFVQREVVVLSRNAACAYMVRVRSQTYSEHKLPFAGANLPGSNSIEGFLNDLKRLYALKDCENVLRFVGVVLDDTRKHLKSYLNEMPVASLGRVFIKSETHNQYIPWPVREIWAKQIITAVKDIHANGVAIDALGNLNGIGLRPDGSAVLSCTSIGKQRLNSAGHIPPENRYGAPQVIFVH